MATKTWVGGTSTNVGTAANWSGAAVPALNDTCVWGSVTTFAPSTGVFTNAIDNFYVTEGAGWGTTSISRDWGTPSSPLTLSAMAGTLRCAIRGNCYLTSSGTVVAASFEMPNGGTATISGGTWTTVTTVNVIVNFGASAIVTNIQNIGATIEAATGTAITSYVGTGKLTTNSRDVTTMTLDGPTSRAVATGTSAIATLNVLAGAMHNHQGSGGITIANLRGTNSMLTPVGASNTTGTPAIVGTANVWSGAALVESVSGYTLTVSVKNNVGPSVTAPSLIV